MVSSSCSTTISVLPMSRRCLSVPMQLARCRAGAGRWTAHPEYRARRQGWNRSASPAGCAGPRRRRACPPRGRASDSPDPTSTRKRRRALISLRIGAAIMPSFSPKVSEAKNACASMTDRSESVGNGFAADRHRQNLRAEAFAAAVRAGRLAHQTVVIRFGGVALRFGGSVAPWWG